VVGLVKLAPFCFVVWGVILGMGMIGVMDMVSEGVYLWDIEVCVWVEGLVIVVGGL